MAGQAPCSGLDGLAKESWGGGYGNLLTRRCLGNTSWTPIAAGGGTQMTLKFPSGNEILRFQDFPGGPVVKTLHFQCRRRGFDSWSGN